MKPTQARLKELFSYARSTGLFTRLTSYKGKNFEAGEIAGCLSDKGYVMISVDGKQYRAHHLAWVYVHGIWPVKLDHKNRKRADNRFRNLRESTQQQQLWNQSKRACNTSGVKGVCFDKATGMWMAQFRNGSIKYKKRFPSKQQAKVAYDAVAKLSAKEFFCHG